jgi:glycogen debranching enzyme
VDADRLEEPGRIIHETRTSELAAFGQVPYGRYYATVDATPLFVVLLSEYTRVTGDEALAVELAPAARRALEHIATGLDRDGYLTYPTDRPGLRNHCWKDSDAAICFPDGRFADGPVAVCEAQGYAYDALVRSRHPSEIALVWCIGSSSILLWILKLL